MTMWNSSTRKEILKEKNQIDDGLGYPEWRLSLCLLFSWAVTFIITRRGVQSSGKASYFLALFPYVIMVTLLIRAATLEGADKGMLYFINPVWSKLLEPQVTSTNLPSLNLNNQSHVKGFLKRKLIGVAVTMW